MATAVEGEGPLGPLTGPIGLLLSCWLSSSVFFFAIIAYVAVEEEFIIVPLFPELFIANMENIATESGTLPPGA